MSLKKAKELEKEKEKLKSLIPELKQNIDENREELNKCYNQLDVITNEIFFEKHGFENKYKVNETTTVPIFNDGRGGKGSYTWGYLGNFHMPILYPSNEWKCTHNDKGYRCRGNLERCDSESKIRLSDTIEGIDFNGEQLFYYMKKSKIENIFNVKIKKVDLIDLKNLVAGFYYYENQSGAGHGISAIIDTNVFVEKYKEAIIKKHGFEQWSALNLLLKIASKK